MLTIQPCKVFSHALGEYLRQADYYSEGMKVEGRCFGQLCGAVGLTEHAVISDEAFERVRVAVLGRDERCRCGLHLGRSCLPGTRTFASQGGRDEFVRVDGTIGLDARTCQS